MSLIWRILCGGHSAAFGQSLGIRVTYGLGRLLASLRPGVAIGKSSQIHPESHICARGMRLSIGEKSEIAIGAMIQGNVSMGNNVSVQANGNIVGYEEGRVLIGNDVRIAANCMIIAANHVFEDANKTIHEQGLAPSEIRIEDDVWIGGTVNICAGVTIGKGSVIGAGSVVTKSIPPYSVAVGSPCKVIGNRS